MRRDRVTFAMMLGVPLILLLSCSASPSTTTRSGCRRRWWRPASDRYYAAPSSRRSTVTDYYRFVDVGPERRAEAEGLIASGDVAFVVTIPSDFGARVDARRPSGRS